MTTKTYVVLQRRSLTNPSDKFRVVTFEDWRRHSDGEAAYIPVVSEHDTDADAQAAANELNGRVGA